VFKVDFEAGWNLLREFWLSSLRIRNIPELLTNMARTSLLMALSKKKKKKKKKKKQQQNW
jgi:hypothetical protein